MVPTTVFTEKDRDTILSYISYAGGGGLTEDKLDFFLRYWYENKKDIYNIFGNQLILSKRVQYDTPDEVINNQIDSLYLQYSDTFSKMRRDITNYQIEYGTIKDDKIIHDTFDALLTTDNLRLNKLSYYSCGYAQNLDFLTPQGNRVRITEGAKPMRLLGKLARAFGYSTQYERFRIAISQCLNTLHLEGTLCLSIHPMDYMTMSDNDYNWDSCMSWLADGEYKQGTLEMMNSPYCIVAYLAGEDNQLEWGQYYFYSSSPDVWNSKKWRQLLFIHPAFIVANRQYPYDAPSLETIALNWLKELAEKANYSTYRNEITLIKNHSTTQDLTDEPLYWTLSMNQMYNDLSTNRYYLATNLQDYTKMGWNTARLDVCLSGPATCINCGAEIYETPEARLLECSDCMPGFYCSCCGDYNSDDPEYTNSDGDEYCYYCFSNSNNINECNICEEYTHHELDEYLIVNNNNDIVSDVCVCHNCDYHSELFPLFGELNMNGNFLARNVSEEGLDILRERGKEFYFDEDLGDYRL